METLMNNSSHPPSTPSTESPLVAAAAATLRELERVRDLAFAHGKGESWAALYTNGYMLKLRAMRHAPKHTQPPPAAA